MKPEQQRIPFGNETKLEILSPTCPGCNATHGSYHEYGCPLESCPECGGRLLKCTCMVLSMVDEFKIARAVADYLSRNQVFAMSDRSELLDQTYEEKGAFSWIIKNAPPELKREMSEMTLELLGAEKNGDMMRVPLDKAAEAMGISTEEAAPIMQELEAECLYPGWHKKTGIEQ